MSAAKKPLVIPAEVKKRSPASVGNFHSLTLQAECRRLNALAIKQAYATPAIIDLRGVEDRLQHTTGYWRDVGIKPLSPMGYRVGNKGTTRRRIAKSRTRYDTTMQGLSVQEMADVYRKPLDDWDAEELAMGRPRNSSGRFSGPRPKWITPEMHEEAIERFKSLTRQGMRKATVSAIQTIQDIVENNDVDNRGRPLVTASTKLSAAQFLIEHVIGKPTQRVETDVSVKLQGILGAVMVNPGKDGDYLPAHTPGITMELAASLDDEEEILDAEVEEDE